MPSISTRGGSASWRDTAHAYYRLTKPTIVALILFTAIVGMLLSSPGAVPLDLFILATIGIGLSAASSAVINQLIEQDRDAHMSRTSGRPLVRGLVERRHAIAFAASLAVLGMLVLWFGVNRLTALLTFASLIGYGFVYTAFLKPLTSQNIVIGGAAGAAPPVLGWTAMTGTIVPDSLLLFLIIFCWTPPHFWALCLYKRKDYINADIPMLPNTHGEEVTRLHIVLYTVLVALVSLLLVLTGRFGWLYAIGAGLLNAMFIAKGFSLWREYSDYKAKRLFIYSNQYLTMLFALMLVDHYRPLMDRALGSVFG
ncbi:heme o synthase [Gammaproteobacteria bacterium]|nr:heme o synthase [Gammaproteobacteria bacterium]